VFLAADPDVSGSISGATTFPEKQSLKRGPLSIVSINEELLERKYSGFVLGK
jgi:hypothetical protein